MAPNFENDNHEAPIINEALMQVPQQVTTISNTQGRREKYAKRVFNIFYDLYKAQQATL